MPTVNKLFGIADPHYDALRVLSTQALEAGPGDGTSGGGGLENKIYLWPADGSTISTYDPTEAGLIAALAAATTGDTVWLPSIPIAITQGVTIPASVALVGISNLAQIVATGFSGVAITMSQDSVAQQFTLNFTSNGTTGIGILAAQAGAVIQHVNVIAGGGTALNIAVDFGSAPVAREIWFATQDAIYWNGMSGNWNQITSLPDANPLGYFGITHDGSTVYVATHQLGDDYNLVRNLYKCTNPKAAVPTWTSILQAGDDIGGGVQVSLYFSYTFGPLVLSGSNLYTVTHTTNTDDRWAYGYYNGSVWTWTAYQNYNTFSPNGAGNDTFTLDNNTFDGDNTLLESLSGTFYLGYQYYKSPNGTRYISKKASNVLYIHKVGAADLATLGAATFDQNTIDTKITGSETGNEVYAVSAASGADGHLWLSDDGTNFTDVATWAEGYVKDCNYNGGGDLIWILLDSNTGVETVRRYARSGLSYTDLTANLWSLTTGAQEIVGMGLVY